MQHFVRVGSATLDHKRTNHPMVTYPLVALSDRTRLMMSKKNSTLNAIGEPNETTTFSFKQRTRSGTSICR